MTSEAPLSRVQRRLLALYRRWGATPLILAITAVSTAMSLSATAVAVALQSPTRGDWIASMVTALVIPLIIAPLASSATVRLLGTIVAAHDRLDYLASTDPLTGVANRRRFFAAAEERCADVPDGQVVMVGVIDVDDFKDVNDRFGHSAGDAALVRLAAALSDALGDGGLAARVGGDEFACLVSGSPDDVRRAVKRVTRACAAMPLREGHLVTASCGFSTLEGPGDIDSALYRADSAQYAAKDSRTGPAART